MVFFYQNCSDQLWADVICTWMFSYLLHLKVLSLFVSSNWISRISAFFNFMLFSICAIFFLILKRGSQRELPFLRSIIFKRRSVKVKVVIYKSRDETFLWIIIWDSGWFGAEKCTMRRNLLKLSSILIFCINLLNSKNIQANSTYVYWLWSKCTFILLSIECIT